MTNLNSEQTNSEQNNIPESSLTVMNGGNFYFDVNGQQVRVWFACFSGAEKIFINDKLVSRKRSWRKLSTHQFTLDGESYTLKVGVRSWSEAFEGIYIAELYRGEQLIDQDEVHFLHEYDDLKSHFSWKACFKELLPLVIIGGFVGYLVGYFILAKIF
ncbi:hypothetical protein ACO1PK_09705 [Alishewanella sp. d11]|uniref:hypothetical protein n=1 Tax=Alishewanella sp. d11 TaxID=3414030 RepID=UPI003BF861EA